MNADNHTGSPPASPEAFWNEAEVLGRALAVQLEYFEALGVTEVPAALMPPPSPGGIEGKTVSSGAQPKKKPVTPPRPAPAAQETPPPARDDAPAIWAAVSPSLADLAEKTSRCRACPLAPAPPAQPLFGRGALSPLIVLVGPDPSIFEGEKAGLLTGIIEKGLKLDPEEYYITSLVRCGLTDEADASAEKKTITACGPILKRELALLKPKVVLAMGSKAGRFLSGSTDPVGLLRSKTRTVEGLEGAWLRVTFGLSHMLSSVEIKKEAWKDIQKIIPGLNKLKKV